MEKNKRLDLPKDLLYKYYIEDMMTSKEVGKIFGCTSKCIRNYLIKYGIPVRQNAEAVKLERSKWSKEKELSRSKHFIDTWGKKSEEERRDIATRKTVNINTPSSIEKAKKTKFINGTSKVSKSENLVYEKLTFLFCKEDVIRGYYDKDKYPFNCDFYIKSKGIYIEYQGHQTHGIAPYDKDNANHISHLKHMEDRGIDMTTWTKRDVNKLNVATRNKITLLLIYPRNESYLLKNSILRNIGKIDINKINELI